MLNSRNFSVQIPNRILFGEATVEGVPNLVLELRVESILIVTDSVIRRIGLIDHVEHILRDKNIKTEILDQWSLNQEYNSMRI